MPYIKSTDGRREKLLEGDIAQTPGELNFQIFSYVKQRLENNLTPLYSDIQIFVNDFLGAEPNYQKYNDITGCLVRCHKEIKRRLNLDNTTLIDILESYDEQINTYEDKKIEENGDV